MTTEGEGRAERDYLKRLSADHYCGRAQVHWSMSIADRKTGWLDKAFHLEFREILTHTMFRYALACPIYCCMPDHIHLLWIGISDGSEQLVAAKYFRKHLNAILAGRGAELQKQAYDRVLRATECSEDAFETVVAYITDNPARSELVPPERVGEYPFTGCLVPGYPELSRRQDDFWERFWRAYEYLRINGLLRAGR